MGHEVSVEMKRHRTNLVGQSAGIPAVGRLSSMQSRCCCLRCYLQRNSIDRTLRELRPSAQSSAAPLGSRTFAHHISP